MSVFGVQLSFSLYSSIPTNTADLVQSMVSTPDRTLGSWNHHVIEAKSRAGLSDVVLKVIVWLPCQTVCLGACAFVCVVCFCKLEPSM